MPAARHDIDCEVLRIVFVVFAAGRGPGNFPEIVPNACNPQSTTLL